MNRPKWTAARTVATLGAGVLVSAVLGYAPVAGATSHSATAQEVGGRAQRAPDDLMPASVSVPAPATGGSPATGAATDGNAASSPHAAPARDETTDTGTFNWSGEFETGSEITAVSGSWTVPDVKESSQRSMVSTWVGIGGLSTTSPLIQAGTNVSSTGGVTQYTAWYEMLPAQPYTLTAPGAQGGTASFTVAPGDVMSVSLTNEGGDTWAIVIENDTTGWRFDHAFSYQSTESSAEWITERPAYLNGDEYSLYTLSDYGTSRFTDLQLARADGSPTLPTSLDAFAMVDTTGYVISAPGPVSSSTGASFTDHYVSVPQRISGATADATAAAELETAFPSASGNCPGTSSATRAVVLATNGTYPDALASAYLTSVLDTGTLLTAPTSLTATTLQTIRDEGITHVYVVGGTLAVSPAVADELEDTHAYACGGATELPGTQKVQVTRIGGATEYDTAEMIAETPNVDDVGDVDLAGAYAGTNGSGGQGMYNATAGSASAAAASTSAMRTAVLVTGKNFQDAESASTLAYADRLPILLTTPASLSAQSLSAIDELGVAQVVVMGGPDAVSAAVVSALEADGLSVLRIAGADGTQTAVELAECELGASGSDVGFGWPATGGVAVARGDFYTDGLAGAAVAAGAPTRTSPEPLLLSESPSTVGPYLGPFMTLAGTTGIDGKIVTHFTILGGIDAVTQVVSNTLSLDLLG